MALKVATIGCGRMGAFASETASKWTPDFWQPISHLPAIEVCENMNAVAAADISIQTRKRVEKHFKIPCYASTEELLLKHTVDILTLATRTPEKPNLIRQALSAGVRGFHIEKPLCNSLSELKELEILLKNVPVTYGCLRRYLSPYRNLGTIAENSNFGKLTSLQVHMGRAMLYWTHPHSVDLILMQTDQTPTGIQANFSPTKIHSNSDGISIQEDPIVLGATIFFNGNLTGHITQMPGNEFWTIYEKGALRVVNDGRALIARQCRNGDPYPTDKTLSYNADYIGGTSAALDLLNRAICGDLDAKLETDWIKKDMFLGQYCLFAMAQSHFSEGRRIDLKDMMGTIKLEGLYGGVPA